MYDSFYAEVVKIKSERDELAKLAKRLHRALGGALAAVTYLEEPAGIVHIPRINSLDKRLTHARTTHKKARALLKRLEDDD